jgi:magnesium-transporting ATPase (P-type)
MTVVEGWFGTAEIEDVDHLKEPAKWISPQLKELIVQNSGINRTAYLVEKNEKGEILENPMVIGNKTEGALINLIRSWGEDYEKVKAEQYNENTDKIFPFDSTKKRSTAIVFNSDGAVRLYVKGATEVLLTDCSYYTDINGDTQDMNDAMKNYLETKINSMAKKALRTLMLAHVDFKNEKDLPADWETCPPDDKNLICDSIVGIVGTDCRLSILMKIIVFIFVLQLTRSFMVNPVFLLDLTFSSPLVFLL